MRKAAAIVLLILGTIAFIFTVGAKMNGNPPTPPPTMPAPVWTERCQPVHNPLYQNGTDCQ